MARSAETKTQILKRSRVKTEGKVQGKFAPYFGFVQAYSADTESVLVDSHGGRRTMFSPQPHLGQTAWMRAAPEGGMGSLMVMRSDAQEPEVMRWWDVDVEQRLRLYRQSVENLAAGSGQLTTDEAFRPIESGEIDMQSRGGAAIYMGSRPHMDMRAGIIRLVMDQDETEFMSKAPLHIRRGHKNVENEIGDEERFGVVRRAVAGSFVDRVFLDSQGRSGNKANGFAKEHLIKLANGSRGLPATLFDHREGNVMDNEGLPLEMDETGINLRTRKEYFTSSDTSVVYQIDESGNFKIEHPQEAAYGGLFILPTGSMRARIGGNFTRDVGRNEVATIIGDKIQSIGNNKTDIVASDYNLTIGNNETKAISKSSTETIAANKTITITGKADESVALSKTIKVGGALIIQAGTGNIMAFSSELSSFQTETLTISATNGIVIEAPQITFNTPIANFSGDVNVNGTVATNGPVITPSTVKGSAGPVIAPPVPAIPELP